MKGIGMGREEEVTTIRPRKAFERWFDKAFVALMGVTLSLVAYTYTSLSNQVTKLDEKSSAFAERITKVEERTLGTDKRLDKIDGQMERLIQKIDRLLEGQKR